MSKKISLLALFTAFAVILGYVESFIPSIGIPGVKLGLANLAVLLALYYLGVFEGITVSMVRILIIGMFFGNLFSILFSVAGALISYLIMVAIKKINNISIITVGIFGGVFHNIGQIIVAIYVVETYQVIYYLPVLIISGIITGAIIGIISKMIYVRTKGFIKLGD